MRLHKSTLKPAGYLEENFSAFSVSSAMSPTSDAQVTVDTYHELTGGEQSGG
jgi:hypothetical protein